MSRPGTMIAIRKSPTEKSPIAASSTPSAEGGIMIARPPDPRMGPSVIGFA